MATLREQLGWTEQREQAVNDAVSKAIARTAMCRKVIPRGADQLGAVTVAVPAITGGGAGSYKYGADIILAPVQIKTELEFDDQRGNDEPALLRLFETAASELGKKEDQRIVLGAGGTPRNPTLVPWELVSKKLAAVCSLPTVDAEGVLSAVTEAVGRLDTANRPGPCGLLLNSRLFALLRRPTKVGEGIPLPQVEALLGSNEIAGVSCLEPSKADKDKDKDKVVGLVFRIDPAAIDLVYTKLPTITFDGRSGGVNKLLIEEEIVLRILDSDAVVRLLQP